MYSTPKIQLAPVKHKVSYKCIDDMLPSSIWDAMKKRLCCVFSAVETEVHEATQIHSRPQAVNETLQEYIL